MQGAYARFLVCGSYLLVLDDPLWVNAIMFPQQVDAPERPNGAFEDFTNSIRTGSLIALRGKIIFDVEQ